MPFSRASWPDFRFYAGAAQVLSVPEVMPTTLQVGDMSRFFRNAYSVDALLYVCPTPAKQKSSAQKVTLWVDTSGSRDVVTRYTG
jgi:hypothetical protein